MDFSKIALFSMMKTKMGYLSERQDVLSQNIANVDTPGYQARDLKKLEFENMALDHANKLSMRTSSPAHQQPSQQEADFRAEKIRKTYEMSPTKNKVVIEEQMMKVAETSMQYQATTNLYKKMSEMFKTAIGNR
ncbi:MAG: flagellar basal body rod protein FlgB [Alphaproteobacteria bacterium]|nr:flagellar basal body rod protein FlgB [Alphaproteobacteria bacterium]